MISAGRAGRRACSPRTTHRGARCCWSRASRTPTGSLPIVPASRSSTISDLARYARTLYSRLRDADDRDIDTVIAVMPPAEGLGHAIRDRLTKAATPPR